WSSPLRDWPAPVVWSSRHWTCISPFVSRRRDTLSRGGLSAFQGGVSLDIV
ncbi:MAG: hypothetical protein AVDCRST_MAG43-1617, partial [uncultured Thermomicrobiales bacterium]